MITRLFMRKEEGRRIRLREKNVMMEEKVRVTQGRGREPKYVGNL